MASGDGIIRALLQYDVDSASQRRVVDSTQKVGKAFSDAEKQVKKLAETTESKLRRSLGEIGRQKYIDSIGEQLRKATKDAKTFELALEEVSAELRRVGATESEINRVAAVAGGSGSRRQNTLERIGREIVGVPDIGPSTDIGQALRLIGAAGGSVRELGAAAAIAGPAVALAVIAIKDFTAANEAVARTTRGFIDASEEVNRLLVTGTSETARARLRELEDEKEVTRRRVNEVREFIRQAEAAIDNGDAFTNVMGNAAMALGINVGGIEDLRAANRKLTEEYESNRIAVDRVNQALANGEFVLNDAEAAVGEFFSALDDRIQDAAETVGDFADTLFDIGEKARASNQRITELETRRDEQLTQISSDAADARTKLVEDAEIRRTRLVEDSEARIAEIRRRANAAFLNASRVAIGERDALGLYMAQLAKDEAEEQVKEQERQNSKALQRLEEDLARQLELNRDTERKRLQQQRDSAQRQIDTERAKANALLQIQSRQVNSQISIAAQGAGALVSQTAGMFNNIIQQAANAAQQVQFYTRGGFGGLPAPQFNTSGGFGGLPSIPTFNTSGGFGGLPVPPAISSGYGFLGQGFANGGFPPAGRRVLVGEQGPEMAVFPANTRVYSNSETRRMMAGGGITIPITINGTNKSVRQIEAIAAGKLRAAFREAGWDK